MMRRILSGMGLSMAAAAIALACTGWYAVAQQAENAQPAGQAAFEAGQLEIAPEDSQLQKLVKERYNAALAAWKFGEQLREHGLEAEPLEALLRLSEARVAVDEAPEAKVAFLERVVEHLRAHEKYLETQAEAARATEADLHEARYFRLDAEIRLLKAREGLQGSERGE